MISFAIYYESFSLTEPVKQEMKILDVLSKTFNNSKIDWCCLGS